MPLRLTTLVLAVFVGISAVAEIELDNNGLPKQDMLKHLAPYAGHWQITINSEPTEQNPKQQTYSAVQEAGFILDGTMFQFRTVTTTGGKKTEALVLIGFDRVEQSYCMWFYGQGGFMVKSRLEWADDGKSYRSVSLDKEQLGATASADVRLIDKDTIRWTNQVVRNDGVTLAKTHMKARRKHVEIIYPEREAKDSDKLAIFEDYTGTWKTVLQGKVTDVNDAPYRMSNEWEGQYLLGGDLFAFNGPATTVDGQDYEYLWLYAYNPQKEQYVCWYHSSFVYNVRQDVIWNEKDRSLKMIPENLDKLPFTPEFTTFLVDEETLRFTFKATSKDGVLLADEVGDASPVRDE